MSTKLGMTPAQTVLDTLSNQSALLSESLLELQWLSEVETAKSLAYQIYRDLSRFCAAQHRLADVARRVSDTSVE